MLHRTETVEIPDATETLDILDVAYPHQSGGSWGVYRVSHKNDLLCCFAKISITKLFKPNFIHYVDRPALQKRWLLLLENYQFLNLEQRQFLADMHMI